MPPSGARGSGANLAGQSYLRSGFVLALALRLLTASLAIVIPLFAVDSLGATSAGAGVFVVLLWVGNAVGVVSAVAAVRDQSVSSLAGFSVMALSLASLGYGGGGQWASFFAFTSGVGMGLPQPFLSALMHVESGPDAPFLGLGLYSTALGVGLVLGPLVSYGVLSAWGFSEVFVALSLVCVLGIGGALLGRGVVARGPRPPLPSPSAWMKALGDRVFGRAFAVNFIYSLLLPIFLSYGAIFAEGWFGFSSTSALLLFTLVFVISVSARVIAARLRSGFDKLLLASLATLLASTLCMGLATSWPVFVLGMLLFSLPHAFVFPVTSYFAFSSARGEGVMNASYAFQASSGVAELLSPAAAVLLVASAGVPSLFLAGSVIAAAALVAATYSSPWSAPRES